VEIEATFTSPSGRQITWWGFYDGDGQGGQSGNIWKVRFMPDELGTWSFTWQFSDGSPSGSASFQAVDDATHPAKPGPLQHHPDIHQWLVTADGSRHVFLNMYSQEDDYALGYYTNPVETVGRAKSYGFDVIEASGGIAHYSWERPMDSTNPLIYMNKSDYTPRLQGWYLMENGLFRTLYDEEVYLFDFYGLYGGNGVIDLHTKSISFQDKVLKYIVSRTAPYYFHLYNIGFELPEFVSVPSWPVERAQYVKSIDPWDHLITGHEFHGWSYSNASYKDVIDFSALQNDDNFHGRALEVWNSPSEPHPHCNECIWNAQWQAPGTEASHRRDLWDGITGGMSYYFYISEGYPDTGRTAFQHANAFLKNGVKWWTMSPHDEVMVSGTAYVLAKLGVEYVVYSSLGSSFTLDLPEGSYNWRWFDPANGTYTDWTSLDTSGGAATFNKPNTNDWVLHISGAPPDSTPSPTSIPSLTPTPTATPTPTSTPTATPAFGDGLITDIVVSNGKTYEKDTLYPGKLVYIDRSYTFTSVPAAHEGREFIRTANDDRNATNPDFLTFTLTADATVCVAYDDRATSLPAWLDDSWTLTGDTIGTSDMTRRLYKKDFPAGSVTLGGNAMPPTAGADSNYNVTAVLFGDFDGDGDVDVDDVMQVASRWRTSCDNPDPDNHPDTPNYDPLYDVDDDCDIDIVDIMRVASHWGERCE